MMDETRERIEKLARDAMQALYEKQLEGGIVNTCCFDFGIPAVVKAIETALRET